MSIAPDTSSPEPEQKPNLGVVGTGELADWEQGLRKAEKRIVTGDARDTTLVADSVDLVVTSPPYWQKRDYGHDDQIGQEATPQGYVSAMMDCLDEWKRVLRPTGSVFLNVGDTYYKKSLVGIPGRIEAAAVDNGWLVRNRIIWTKDGGMPEPAKNRLANRHEYIIHLAPKQSYYYDLYEYSEAYGNGANPGDVWQINPERNMSAHLAPYPQELVRRAILLGCPPQVCETCGKPRTRVLERTRILDPSRPQARRAMELADEAGLTDEHIRAIQATGVSDVGKATKFQSGTGRNSKAVQALAAEAKEILGGYFREFTFAKKVTTGWTDCGHDTPSRGVVLDPFVGTGTTLNVAMSLGRDAVGVDLIPMVDHQAPRVVKQVS
ncbi:site-specific DNA-methyltransferase [Nocardia sp. XZ_19_369]|uniref:DNA-methyltransferase n=1 Tax=Nocardia sp. XZ_19_369 TaxID=2769487 RepID=UPI00188E0A47|nr:site-specific DNA-methyltransferase [Nocardia sp. XZ_19_369]